MNQINAPHSDKTANRPVPSDKLFFSALVGLPGVYLVMIIAMLVAMGTFTSPSQYIKALQNEEIQYAIKLSMFSCTITAICSLWVAVPTGYLLSRFQFRGKALIDSLLDIPIVLPPLVIGLALLILFQTPLSDAIYNFFYAIEQWLIGVTGWRWINLTPEVTFAVPAVILAQFMVACAFAVRTMRVTFDQINPRTEQVAMTLGCSRGQAFWRVAVPESGRGMMSAATLAWARSLGEFGPILVFAGATRMRTEVLPTTVFLELSTGNIEAAAAVSLIMVTAAVLILVLARLFGIRTAIA